MVLLVIDCVAANAYGKCAGPDSKACAGDPGRYHVTERSESGEYRWGKVAYAESERLKKHMSHNQDSGA